MPHTQFIDWLTVDQRAVFSEVLRGVPGRQIAEKLGIPHPEVEALIKRTCRKLGVRLRGDGAVLIAMHLGWTLPEECRSANSSANSMHNGPFQRFSFTGMGDTESEPTQRNPNVREVDFGSEAFPSKIGIRNTDAEQSRPQHVIVKTLNWRMPALIAIWTASLAVSLSALVSVFIGMQQIFGR